MPTDTTPDPRDMMRAPDEPEFRQPEHDDAAAARRARASRAHERQPAIGERPPLPVEAEVRADDLGTDAARDAGGDEPALAGRPKGDSELQRG